MGSAASQVGDVPGRLRLPDSDPDELPPEPARPRPLLIPAVALIVGIVLSEYLGPGPTWLGWPALVLPLVVFAILLLVPNRLVGRRGARIGLLIVSALACGYARHQSATRLPPNHIVHYLGDEAVLTRLGGVIVTTPVTAPADKRNPFLAYDPPPKTRFVLAARELLTTDPPTPVSGNVRVSVEGEALAAGLGDGIVVTGKLYRPRGPRNPGEPDWHRWSRLQGIHAALAVDGPQYVARTGAPGSSHRLVAALRTKAQSLLFEPLADADTDEPVRLLDTMVLGHRTAAGRRLNEAFLRTGGMHFLAVSGFHVGVLAWAVWVLVRKALRRSSRTTAAVVMVTLLTYAVIAEPNAPILRATTVGVFGCLALLLRPQRPLCAVNWLSAAALCVLAYNPLELFRAGFQLSFIQVLMLLTVFPRVFGLLFRRKSEDGPPPDIDRWSVLVPVKVGYWLAGLAVVCMLAWITALPLVLYHFGRFAPWGWAQSVLMAPLVIATIVMALLTVVTGPIPLLSSAVGAGLRVVTGWLLTWVEVLGQLPGTLVAVQRPPAWLVILTYAAGVLLVRWWLSGRWQRLRLRGSLLTIVSGGLLWTGWLVLWPGGTGPGYAVHVLSVGSGNATLVTAPNRHALLVDVGTLANSDVGETAAAAIRELGVRTLDGIAISHANFDHYSGLPTMLLTTQVKQILVNPYFEQAAAERPSVQALARALPADAPPRAVIRSGDHLSLHDGKFEVLWPPADLDGSWAINDRSLVLRFSVHGRRVLIPGDIERDAIRALLAAHAEGRIDLRADVLIAPHHGSVIAGDRAAFYAAVSPQAIIVSTARERRRLAVLVRETLGADCRLISTRDVGAVTVRVTPDGELVIETPYARTPH